MTARKVIAVFFLISMLFLYVLYQFNQSSRFPVLKGPYLGQRAPGDSAEVFAPGIVSTGMTTRDIAITPDGKEIYFGVILGHHDLATILVSRQEKGQWTEPEVASFARHPDYKSLEPAISPDGQHFYFASDRPDESSGQKAGNYDLWMMEKTESGWSEPANLKTPVNTEGPEFFPSVTRDGTLYFTRDNTADGSSTIYRSRLKNGRYQTPEKLGPVVNSGRSRFNAFVSPDESYLIVPVFGRKDSFGATDYYICFRDNQDNWSGPFHLNTQINSASGQEYSPYVSPDGKYFFFMSPKPAVSYQAKRGRLYPLTREKLEKHYLSPDNGNANICWISTDFIKTLRP